MFKLSKQIRYKTAFAAVLATGAVVVQAPYAAAGQGAYNARGTCVKVEDNGGYVIKCAYSDTSKSGKSGKRYSVSVHNHTKVLVGVSVTKPQPPVLPPAPPPLPPVPPPQPPSPPEPPPPVQHVEYNVYVTIHWNAGDTSDDGWVAAIAGRATLPNGDYPRLNHVIYGRENIKKVDTPDKARAYIEQYIKDTFGLSGDVVFDGTLTHEGRVEYTLSVRAADGRLIATETSRDPFDPRVLEEKFGPGEFTARNPNQVWQLFAPTAVSVTVDRSVLIIGNPQQMRLDYTVTFSDGSKVSGYVTVIIPNNPEPGDYQHGSYFDFTRTFDKDGYTLTVTYKNVRVGDGYLGTNTTWTVTVK